MTWTEPSCVCGGSGGDGCRPIEIAIAIGIERLRTSIGVDLAEPDSLTRACSRDVTRALERLESPTDLQPTSDRTVASVKTSAPALPSPGLSDLDWERLMKMREDDNA